VEAVTKIYSRIAIGLLPFAPNTVAILTEEMPVDPTSKESDETEMRLDKCAKAWDAMAVKNPHVRRMLEKYATVSPVAELIELNLPIAVSLSAEMGLFSQLGKLAGKLFTRKEPPVQQPEPQYYGPAGYNPNPEFGRTVA
jgi:hypothetical protein